MKRLALTFSLLLILVLYTFFSEKYVLKFCTDIDNVLQECALLINEKKYSQAENAVSNLYNLWENNDILLSVIMGDGTVREPQKNIVSIRLSFADKNYGECLITIRECQGYIREISKSGRTSFYNLF